VIDCHPIQGNGGGSRNAPSLFMLRKLEIIADLIGHKAPTQTLPERRRIATGVIFSCDVQNAVA
jgi:cytochrome c553